MGKISFFFLLKINFFSQNISYLGFYHNGYNQCLTFCLDKILD